jgi:hypothetical protein
MVEERTSSRSPKTATLGLLNLEALTDTARPSLGIKIVVSNRPLREALILDSIPIGFHSYDHLI